MKPMKLAFLGLGVMGAPMAAHLAEAGHAVTVYNRTPAKAEAWCAAHGGARAPSAAEAAANAELVFACVTADADTRVVAKDAFEGMNPGAIFIDHGSGSADAARALASAAEKRGLHFLDAPVTGGRVGAENGALSIMVGGDVDILARAAPVMAAYARSVTRMGAHGAGHLTKLVNVVIGHGTGVALAEGLGFAISAGLDPALVVEVLIQGSSRSWQMEHRSAAMIARDFNANYTLQMARKDLGNALAEARRSQAPVPLSTMADQIYAGLIERGLGGADTASLIEYFTRAQTSAKKD